MRVLLVDSAEEPRFRITDELRKNGYSVDSAVDGEEGVRLALAEKFDAVITEMTTSTTTKATGVQRRRFQLSKFASRRAGRLRHLRFFGG